MGDATVRLTREQRRLAELLLRQRGLDPDQLPIPRRSEPARAPLSVTQRRLWTSGQIAPGTAYGNVPMAVRIRGPLELDALARALSLIVERHEVLRTTFPSEGGEPVQRIHPPSPVRIALDDLRPAPDREQRFAARVDEEARRPFDPARETLLRGTAFRLDETEWGVVLVSHHLATDGWGARLLLDELTGAYRAFLEGREPALPALPVQYGDYAEWEVERVEGGALEEQRRHWLARLAGAPRQLALPFERADSGDVETDHVKISLPEDVVRDLRKLSRARGVTPYVLLLAGLGVALHRCTGQEDIVVGTILSRRTRSETEPLIGNFGNNLLLRTALDGDPSLAEVVDRTAATVRDALAFSDVPLELVAREAPIPAFQTMFIVRDGGLEERLDLPGASVEGVRAGSKAATLDLSLDITDGSRGIDGYFEYRRARLAAATVRELARAFEEVVGRMTRDPATRLSALPRLELLQPAAVVERPRPAGEPPASHAERVLARIWSEMLEVETVYRGDRFFALGGDSLRAAYVLEKTEKALGLRLRPEELSRGTLADLAARCDGRAVEAPTSVDDREPAPTLRRVDPLRFAAPIKALFEREGMPHLAAFFDLAYPAAAREGAGSWIALDERDVVVGHMGMFVHRFTCGTARYTGALGANLVMDRRHRNLTNAIALVQRMASDLEADGSVDFLFGDPNDAAWSIMSNVGTMTEVGAVERFVLPIGGAGLVRPAVSLYLALTLRADGDAPVEMERRAAATFDAREIEEPPGHAALLRPVRPPELYSRRLEGYPTDRDDWFLFTRGGERVAAVLVRRLEAGDRAHLCCIWRRPEIRLATVLQPLVGDLRRQGVTRLQASSLASSPLGRELVAAGFRARERVARFGALACSARGRALLEGGVDWEITDIDCDRGVDR